MAFGPRHWEEFTYSCAAQVTPAATATDIFELRGGTAAVNRPLRLLRILISGTQTTAGYFTFSIVKRNTYNTGGTSGAGTILPARASSPTSTASVLVYSANPGALGNNIGNLAKDSIFFPAPATATSSNPYIIQFGKDCQPPYIEGGTELIAVNFAGTTLTGGLLQICFTWTEGF